MKHRIQLVIAAAAILGLSVPQLSSLSWSVPWLIGVILFVNFSEIDVGPGYLLRKELLITVSLSAVIVPVIFSLIMPKSLSPELRLGILLTAIAPAGIMPLVIGRFLRGVDYPLVLGNFLATTFGSVFYLPPMLDFLAGAEVEMDALGLFVRTSALILLPYAAGLTMNRTVGSTWQRLLDRFAPSAMLVLVFVTIAIIVSKARGALDWNSNLLLVSAMVVAVYVVQGFLAWLGGILFGFRQGSRTMAVVGSSRNNQVSLGIAVVQFPPAVAVPCIIGFIVHHISGAVWLWLLGKQKGEE